MPLGNNVRIFRLARGETLRELAAAVGMDAANLSKIERGLRGCGDEDKLALARYFGSAAAMDAYTLTDRATWANFRNRRNLEIMAEGDPALFNPYSSILVNPAKWPHVKTADARVWHEWLTTPPGRAAISSYRIGGEQLRGPLVRPDRPRHRQEAGIGGELDEGLGAQLQLGHGLLQSPKLGVGERLSDSLFEPRGD